jgi:membrane protein
VLFTIGKSLIGWYLGTTAASSGYGAAGALVLILLWAYYCAQIFLFGAELTRAIAGRRAEPTPMPETCKSWSPARPADKHQGFSGHSENH